MVQDIWRTCSNRFTRREINHCCYFKKFGNCYIILLLYVFDMLIAGSSMREINKLKQQLPKEFEMDFEPQIRFLDEDPAR